MERQQEFERAAVAYARATIRYQEKAERIGRECPGWLQDEALAAAREITQYNAAWAWVLEAHAAFA